jgi:hypothetical protein
MPMTHNQIQTHAALIHLIMEQIGMENFFALVSAVMKQDLRYNTSNPKEIKRMFKTLDKFMSEIPSAYKGLNRGMSFELMAPYYPDSRQDVDEYEEFEAEFNDDFLPKPPKKVSKVIAAERARQKKKARR